MRRAISLVLAVVLGLLAPHSIRAAEITVAAAISLREALEQAKSLYVAQKPDTKITLVFGSSGSLQQQIENGAPVDLFVSAAEKPMDALAAKSLIAGDSRTVLLRNRLVLVIPADKTSPADFAALADSSVKRIAIGEPRSVPAGQYASEVLEHFDLQEILTPKLIYGNNVRQVLTYVASGNVDAGIVYLTDALTTDAVKIAAEAPKNSHAPITYPAAVLSSAPEPAAAHAFLEFLRTAPVVREKFRELGFADPAS